MSTQPILPFLDVFTQKNMEQKYKETPTRILFASQIIVTKWNGLLTAKVYIEFIITRENHRLLQELMFLLLLFVFCFALLCFQGSLDHYVIFFLCKNHYKKY